MDREDSKNLTLVWILFAVFAVFGVIVAAYWMNSHNRPGGSITLPTGTVQSPENPLPPRVDESQFLEVNAQNVRAVIATLHRPVSYRQSYVVTIYSDAESYAQTVELWVDRSRIHAVVLDRDGMKHILTDGQEAYLWYADDSNPVRVDLRAGATLDELLFLPTYELLVEESEAEVVDAGFEQGGEDAPACIYVCEQLTEDLVRRYWVNVETGLLFRSDLLENSIQISSVVQNRIELLAAGDEVSQGQFQLPNGEMPFTAESEMQQP